MHSTNLLTILDEHGVIQYGSPSIERVYGYGRDELVGEPVADYIHPEDRDGVLEAFQRIVDSEEYTIEAAEYRHKQADGAYCWVESVASTDPTPDGEYVINTRDITGQKERELELERKNRRLTEFANIVSHDLRNPLNVAKGLVEQARTECDSDYFEDIEWDHDRMEALIEDLLALAQSGKQLEELEAVDPAAVAESGWQNVVTDRSTLVADADRTIRADRHRLQQLFENLFRNAIEHGGAELTVTVGDLATRDGFYVADNGSGIPDEARKAVFESGYSTSAEGTGLGLYIVEQIAHSHGWDTTLTETEEGGTRFEFTGDESAQ